MGASLLAGILEGSNEVGHIVIIVVFGGLVGEVVQLALQELVLLWSDLLEDVWHHFLEGSGLSISSDNQKVLSDGELG